MYITADLGTEGSAGAAPRSGAIGVPVPTLRRDAPRTFAMVPTGAVQSVCGSYLDPMARNIRIFPGHSGVARSSAFATRHLRR